MARVTSAGSAKMWIGGAGNERPSRSPFAVALGQTSSAASCGPFPSHLALQLEPAAAKKRFIASAVASGASSGKK
jgi:hypothetical protein